MNGPYCSSKWSGRKTVENPRSSTRRIVSAQPGRGAVRTDRHRTGTVARGARAGKVRRHYGRPDAERCGDHRAAHRAGRALRGRHRARGRRRDEGLQGPVRVAAGHRRAGHRPRRQDLHRLRRPPHLLRRVQRPGQRRVRPRCATDVGVGHGDRVAVLSANNPEWCLGVLGHRRPRGDPRRPQRLVEDRRDPLRPRRLAGPRCWSPTASASSASPTEVEGGACPASRRVYLDRRRPGRPRRRPAPAPLRRADRRADRRAARRPPIDEDDPAVIFYTSARPAGRRGPCRPTATWSPTSRTRCSTPSVGTMTGDGGTDPVRRRGRRRRQTGRAVHLAAVPRVGLPLHAWSSGYMAGAEAGDAGRPLRPGHALELIQRRAGQRVGDRADDGLAGLRAPRPPRLRHVVGEERRLRRLTVGRRAPAQGAGDVPQRPDHHATPTASPRPARWPPSSAGRTPIDKPDSVGPPDAGGRAAHRRRRRCDEVPTGETGEVLIKGPIIMPGYWDKPEATAADDHRRLAAHRRHRPPRRRRLPLHHRPGQGHDHPGRRERVLRRDREPAGRAPRDRRRRGDRRAPPVARRGGQGGRAGRARPLDHRGRGEGAGWPRPSPTSRCRPTSSITDERSPATPAASCSRTSSAARARSASPRRCSKTEIGAAGGSMRTSIAPISPVAWTTMARLADRHPGNVDGAWFVDTRCIDCGTCRELRARPVRRDRHPVRGRRPAPRSRGRAPGLAGRGRLPDGVDRPLAPHRPARPPLPADHRRPGVGPRPHVGGFVRGHQLPGRAGRREPHGRLPRLHSTAHRRDRRPRRPGPRAADPPRRRGRRRSNGPSATAPGVDPRRRPAGRAVRDRRHRGVDAAPRSRRASTVIPVPGHTRARSSTWSTTAGSSPATRSPGRYGREDLVAFRGACWYSWSELTTSLGRLADIARFEWVLPGHGPGSTSPADDATRRLKALVARMPAAA